MQNFLTVLSDKLAQHSYRLTNPRIEVFNCLMQEEGRVTMNQLVKSVAVGINRSSVYRTIALYEKLGVVVRLQNGFKHSFELSDLFRPHHHHIRCRICNNYTSIDSKPIEILIDELARRHQFTDESHTFEIDAVCKNCRAPKVRPRLKRF